MEFAEMELVEDQDCECLMGENCEKNAHLLDCSTKKVKDKPEYASDWVNVALLPIVSLESGTEECGSHLELFPA